MSKSKAVIVDTVNIATLIRGVIGEDKWKVRCVRNTIDNPKNPPPSAIVLLCNENVDKCWARVEFKTATTGTIYYYVVNDLNFVYAYFNSVFDNIDTAISELNMICS